MVLCRFFSGRACSLSVPSEEDVDDLVDRRGVHVDLPGVFILLRPLSHNTKPKYTIFFYVCIIGMLKEDETTLDRIFLYTVVLICVYLMSVKQCKVVNAVGLMILISHVYKECTSLKSWPIWSEFVALFAGLLLITDGCMLKKPHNWIVVVLGVAIFCGHCRQLIFEDNRYYY